MKTWRWIVAASLLLLPLAALAGARRAFRW